MRDKDMMRRAYAAFAALTMGLLALLAATAVVAQTIESFYADTSSYEAPAFRITDLFPKPPPPCFFVSSELVDVARSPIRITLLLNPITSCDVPGGRDVTVDRIVGLPSPLPAGRYVVEFGYMIDGEWVFRNSMSFTVDDGFDKCSRIPEANSLMIQANNQVADRLAAVAFNPALDSGLHEKLGKPISAYRLYAIGGLILDYFPLDDTQDVKRRIDAIKDELGVQDVSTNAFICFIPTIDPVDIVEFYNTGLGHYFMTEDKAEIASIESGGAGPGWRRTGERLTGIIANPCRYPAPNSTPLYRFYGTRGIGPNSHFFTADRAECGKVRADPGWTIEKVPFRVWAPVAGKCPPQSLAVHRLYNGRAAQNDSNHRYASRQSIVDAMIASGWTNEGVTLCIPQP